ncbi:MAG: response regulator [Candidatus Promineifilaceae bacterium]
MTYRVLVIDDHDETRDIIAGMLRSVGYDIFTAENGTAGFQKALEITPHLIVTDGMMPDISGWELTRRLRAEDVFAKTPIIMFSAAEEASQKLAGFEAGVDDYMIKPIDPEEFLQRVKLLLASAYGMPLAESEDLKKEPVAAQPTVYTDTKARLVGILGSRGGAGTTTLALNLAASFADMGRKTTLVDLDSTHGHVALYLKQKGEHTAVLNILAALTDVSKIEALLPTKLVPFNRRLQLLLSRVEDDNTWPQLTVAHTEIILDVLLAHNKFVVADIGQGLDTAVSPVIDRADELILCIQPERVSLAVAKRQLKYLKGRIFPGTTLHAVILDFNSGVKLPPNSVSQFLQHPISAYIEIKPAEMTTAVNKGQALIQTHPDANASRLIQKLAQKLSTTKAISQNS